MGTKRRSKKRLDIISTFYYYISMIDIIKELKQVLDEKKISPETAALFIGVNGREIRRWLEEEFVPNVASRRKIRRGVRRIRKVL